MDGSKMTILLDSLSLSNSKQQKLLQSTYDGQPLLQDCFTLQQTLVNLALYPNKLLCYSNASTFTIPFTPDTIFLLTQSSLTISQYAFMKEVFPTREQWRRTLLKYIKQNGFHDYFRPIRKLGRGNFATVYLAEEVQSKQQVAVKAFVKETAYKNNGKKALENQIALMRRCDSPNIIKLYGVYESTNSLYLVLQYIEGVTLQYFFKTQKGVILPSQRKLIMNGLLRGLYELTKKHILHRDIKPQNIIISPCLQHLKILDFGLATDINECYPLFLRCGTPGFVAPQILKLKDDEPARFHLSSDAFSAGCIFYQMLNIKPLFNGPNAQQILHLNRNCKINPPKDGSRLQINLVMGMLDVSSRTRFNAEKCLKHDYFNSPAKNPRISLRQ